MVSFPPRSVSHSAAGRAAMGTEANRRVYRLVDHRGAPHPVLDDLYDSLEAAWAEALAWWQEERGPADRPEGIGVEVSTGSGVWRTLRHPGG